MRDFKMNKRTQQAIVLVLFAIIGAMYIRYTWRSTENDKFEQTKQIARSIVATLPIEDLKALEAKPEDINKPQYKDIKSILQDIIKVNNKVRFAYIYAERNGKIYFIADSEPAGSKDYSPPGQEYTEAQIEDVLQFTSSNEQITIDVTDRWGTWTSVLIPIKDKISGKTIAVFGMDFSSNSWINTLVFEVAESSVLIVLFLLVLLFIFRIKAKNKLLHREISNRKLSEHAIRESEMRFRAIFDQAPLAMALLDLQGTPIISNSSMLKMLGYNHDELSNMKFKDITHSQDSDFDFNYFGDLLDGRIAEYNIEKRYVHKTGKLVWAKLFVTLLRDENGIPKEVLKMAEDITESKNAEYALLESELKFRAFFENSMDAILLTSPDGSTISANQAACKMFGYSEEELINMGKLGIQDPADSRLSALLSKRKSHGSARGEVTFIRKDRTHFPAEISSSLFKNREGFERSSMVIRDITKRKSAEKEITMLAQSLKSINECLSITDLHDKILFVNESFLKTYGYEMDELIGKQISIVGSPNNPKNLVDSILPATIGGEWKGELLNKRKDGSEFPILLSTSIIRDQNNQPSGLIGVATDISEWKRAEKELIEAKNKAEESDRLKSAFLANMSHEIRTPMNGVLGFVGLLKEPDLTGEEKDEYISLIELSGIRMLNIINDIINISKVESGQMELSIKETNINEQLQFIYTFFKPEALQKGVQLLYRCSLRAKKATIKTDKEKIYAVLTNLVKNALKFTNSGTIEFGYNLKSDITPAELEFFVRDTGIGIKPGKLEFIFERFRQGSESLNRNYEGAGLGLSISKAYVEMLGGKIWVESEERKGSIFYFTLPYNLVVEESADTENDVFDKKAANQMIRNARGLKILIAEDDGISEKYTSYGIKAYSREIFKVRTGTEALDICRNNPDIDLILMDIKMPGMDGYEATRQIRQFNHNVVIIAQTAFGFTGDREDALNAGCDDYIAKPYDTTTLVALLNNYF